MPDNPTPVYVTPVPAVKSKTIWFNIGVGIVSFLMYGLQAVSNGQLDIGFQIPAEWMTVITIGGNMILRGMTKAPLKETVGQ